MQYAKSVFRAGKMYRQSGQSHIPLRVNSAGMIPLIFAFSIVILPAYIAQFIHDSSSTPWIRSAANFVSDLLSPGTGSGGQGSSPGFYIFVFLLVVGFSFFYTLVVYQQQNLAENLQKQGGFVPGIRPGPADGRVHHARARAHHLGRRDLPGDRRDPPVPRDELVRHRRR